MESTKMFYVKGFILEQRKGDAKFTKRWNSIIVEASSELRAKVEAMRMLGHRFLVSSVDNIK